MESLPVPRLTDSHPLFRPIVERAAKLTCTTAAFAGLWSSVFGSAWDESCGVRQPSARQQLRAELDGLVAKVYGLNSADMQHILAAFPLVSAEVKAAVMGEMEA